MAPKAKAPDFGSQDYWDQRFTTNAAPFDWLSAPQALDPFITEAVHTTTSPDSQILHIGCGSSLLSHHLKTHVRDAQQIHNVDYSKVVIESEKKRELESADGDVTACARWDAVDLLDHTSLVEVCDYSTYSVIIDKSTSDAISCADDVVCQLPYAVATGALAGRPIEVESKKTPVHPLQLVAVHLALVTKPGATWISLSYTSDRYPFLQGEMATSEEDGTAETGIPDPRLLWTVVSKHQIEADEQQNGSGSSVTHRPKVYHYVYILRRTSTPLFIRN